MSSSAYIEAEIKKRIEEETKKAFESTKFPETKYVKGYGKYEFSPTVRPDNHAIWPCLEQLKSALKAFRPPSDNIHIIHACVKYAFLGGDGEPYWVMKFVDNYGLVHTSHSIPPQGQVGVFHGCPFYLSKPHDASRYKYPLSTRSIDMIKSFPQSVSAQRITYNCGTPFTEFGGKIEEALAPVEYIRELNTSILERDLALEKVSEEKKTVEDSLAIITAELIALKAEKKTVDESLVVATTELTSLRALYAEQNDIASQPDPVAASWLTRLFSRH